MPPGQPLANGANALVAQTLFQFLDGRFHALGLLVAGIGFAVGLETTALIQMKQRSADFLRRQFFIQRPRPQVVRVEAFQRLPLRLVLRHQSALHQRVHQVSATFKIAVAAPPHAPRNAAIGGERLLTLRVAAVGKNPHPGIAQFHRHACLFAGFRRMGAVHRPTDGIRA